MTISSCRHSGLKIDSGSWAGMTLFFFLVYLASTGLNAENGFVNGHLKYNSLLIDNESPEHIFDARLNFSNQNSGWTVKGDYQLIRSKSKVTDDNRLLDLSAETDDGNRYTITHRLDRLHLTHTRSQAVLRIGRQAISWGNGLVYNPMDFFNPFNPASVDTEYKTGDDMLYGQYLFDSGDDLQAVWVGRRDDDGDRSSEVTSIAAKYHGFFNDYEFDALLSNHFDQSVIGLGGVANVGGSVWRGDILSTEIDGDRYTSGVVNASYSWIAFDKNMSGHVELFRNGFGIGNGDYGALNLVQHPELINRLNRGELFTLAKHYLAASATIEFAPLWRVTATLFANLDDHSKLLQLVSRHDLLQDLQLLIALNIPRGDDGTEFGGTGTVGSTDVEESLFVQLGYYF